MTKATLWMLAVVVSLMAGVSAFAFQSANQPIVLTDRRIPGTVVDRSDVSINAPVEGQFLRPGANVSVRPRYDGLVQDLKAGIGLPY